MAGPQHPIKPTTPCPKRWAELDGDGGRRHCSACDLHVVNLSAMTRPAAERFLAETPGRKCIAVALDGQGNSLHRTARVPRWRRLAAALLPALLVPLLPGCRESADEPVEAQAEPDATEARENPAPTTLGAMPSPDGEGELSEEELRNVFELMGYVSD